MYKNEHKFPYRWTKKDANFTKDKGKVMSCFCCGGGSSFGYKLAGYDVVACNEIDPKVMKMYLKKGRRTINGKRLEDVWDFDRVPSDKLVHQNEKPIPLLMQCILKSSNEGDLVFDGFMGSASTALACLRTNRKFLGFELDKDYFNVAQRRIKEEMSNQKDMFGYAGD